MQPLGQITLGRAFDPLTVTRLPGRLNAECAARVLGFQAHDIPVLVAAKLLEPLGKPAPNSVKYFPTLVVEALRQDPVWLDRATKAVSRHWRTQNDRKPDPCVPQDNPLA